MKWLILGAACLAVFILFAVCSLTVLCDLWREERERRKMQGVWDPEEWVD